ncbi:catalase-related domain-containing protein [Dyadobacter sp. 3J3]|uniref:catalase-related domain-containing protein n=1 Tax=Dyadobacter sp. 3J3 TaxID=2606600 RepID=UPI001356F5EE|nr:catalase-related domain-containing protein [Dyadobacter sp. 3J3]
MSDNKKRSGVYLGKGIRFKQGFLSDSECSVASEFTGISPLLMNFNTIAGFSENEEDYNLPGLFYREMLSDEDKINLVSTIVCTLKGINNSQNDEAVKDQLHHFFRIDTKLGLAVADGLKIKVGTFLLSR